LDGRISPLSPAVDESMCASTLWIAPRTTLRYRARLKCICNEL